MICHGSIPGFYFPWRLMTVEDDDFVAQCDLVCAEHCPFVRYPMSKSYVTGIPCTSKRWFGVGLVWRPRAWLPCRHAGPDSKLAIFHTVPSFGFRNCAAMIFFLKFGWHDFVRLFHLEPLWMYASVFVSAASEEGFQHGLSLPQCEV